MVGGAGMLEVPGGLVGGGQLCLDLGNTSSAAGYFLGAELVWRVCLRGVLGVDRLEALIEALSPGAVGLSVVGSHPLAGFCAALERRGVRYHVAGVRSVLPFENGYRGAGRLGADRLCALCGGYVRSGGASLVVVDAGTALTLDYLRGGRPGVYCGGFIVAGLGLRLAALHGHTHALPHFGVEALCRLGDWGLGLDTREAMLGGALHGLVAEINDFIDRITAQEGQQPLVYLTGGDANVLESRLIKRNFASVSLVLEGLNALLFLNI